LARCVPLAEKDEKLAAAQRTELTRQYADRAVETLRQAVAAGYQNVGHLKQHQDLDPLRDREDFRQLLRALEKK
jgi:hypothetical protein